MTKVVKDSPEKRFDQWLQEAKRLRACIFESEVAFFEHLVVGEEDEEAWRTTGKRTFEMFWLEWI